MIALTLCVFYISMYVKEVHLLMTGSAIDEDGSHHPQPYWDYLKVITPLLGHCGLFHQYISKEGEGHNQIKKSCFQSCLPLKLKTPRIIEFNVFKSFCLYLSSCELVG